MPDDELKLTRRRFLEQSAMATAVSATWYSVAMKTDALTRADEARPAGVRGEDDTILPYIYHEPF